tara:strand:- start:37773 stop:38042 length:270 start_codon:yes stop_codon:yes gene_type:complete
MTCKARSQGDQMYCPHCVLTWDNDDDAPPCPLKEETEEDLTAMYKAWARLPEQRNQYQWGCAFEMQFEQVTPKQRAWLVQFCEKWEKLQ